MVGILGMGGIGKTTIAKAIYNSIAFRFEVSCFLENIRETFQKEGPIHLQKKLLSKIITSPKIDNVDEGITLIRQRLSSKRVLLILDDVDHSRQLEKIARESDWFGLGSRIIITTRNTGLLTRHQVFPYEVEGLDEYKGLQLFSWHAFNRDRPNPHFLKLAKDAVRYTRGLPLAITVLGSALKGRDILYWKSKLEEYKRIPNEDIQQKLKISYDGLEENAKNTFLDIACFFKGEDVKYVTKILDSCGLHSYSSITELKEKCLIIEFQGILAMHDLLEEMGREIVRQESPKEPGERSRLWFHEDVRHVLREATVRLYQKSFLILHLFLFHKLIY
jgi:dephospho-CoA kinase